MSRSNALHRQVVREQLRKIGSADIVVGIPSFNNARTIGHVVRAVQAGLDKYFPDLKAVLVNSDGGSFDGTPEVVARTAIEEAGSILIPHRREPFFKFATAYLGPPGKGSAFRAIFEVAATLNARACAVVDSDLRSITPEWVELLIKPQLEYQADFVAPLYQRHKFDGTITNSIVYPLTRALYGRRVRQPIGGDFGFSGRMAAHFLAQDVWDSDIARYGIDVWMTTEALTNGFTVAQSFLGAKIHDAKDPGADLNSMFVQVVGSAFALMEKYATVWQEVGATLPVPTYGFRYEVGLEPVVVNVERMRTVFREGVRGLGEIWLEVIGRGDFQELEGLADKAEVDFRFSPALWTRIVYDFALAYHRRRIRRVHLLGSLVPIYIGRTASFVIEMAAAGQEEAEQAVEGLCCEFEAQKESLRAQWQAKR